MTGGEREDGTFRYFAYGASMDIDRLRVHCPGAEFVSIARLDDHRLGFSIESKRSWLGGVCDVVPAPGEAVWGVIWRVPQADSHALDDHEGLFRDPPAYARYPVTVTTPDGEAVECRSYRVAAPDPKGFAPSRSFKDTIVRAARSRALPESYVAFMESVPDNGRVVGG